VASVAHCRQLDFSIRLNADAISKMAAKRTKCHAPFSANSDLIFEQQLQKTRSALETIKSDMSIVNGG
jgi:hypothetical protein